MMLQILMKLIKNGLCQLKVDHGTFISRSAISIDFIWASGFLSKAKPACYSETSYNIEILHGASFDFYTDECNKSDCR